MSEKAQKKSGGRLWFPGFLLILFCLCGTACGVILSLNFDSRNEESAGTVVVSDKIVQRRKSNRTIWDRLTIGSLIYSGDTIRTADLSGATLYIERNSIDLKEKTFVRIQRSPEDEDSVLIYLDDGNLVITTAPGSGKIVLNLMGRQVEAAPGTILSASTGKDGALVQVSEGTATLTGEDGEKREITSGTMLALDTGGLEQEEKTAAVTQPSADAIPRVEQPESLPLLSAPLNRYPPEGHRFGIEQLRESSSIDFSWSATQGANASIFTLYHITTGGRRQIIRSQPGNHTRWTLENLAALGNGTFIWQVEAVNMTPAGTIIQRGRIVENSFVIDIPRPGQVQMEDPGTLYVY
jgi:hypothetical protein